MGKKPKTGKSKAKAKDTPAQQPMRSKAEQIGADDLKNLLRRCTSWKKQGSEITGQIGENIAKAAETKNLDKAAFAIVRKLNGMTEQKRLTTLACLDYYVDVLELDKSEQGDLDVARQEAGAAEPGTPPGEKDARPPHLRTVANGGTRVDDAAAVG